MAEVYRGYLPGESSVEDIPILGPVVSALAPVERDVITPPETTYVEDMDRRYVDKVIPGEYGEPRLGTSAAVQGILDFVGFLKDDPKGAASAIGEGIASIPEEQAQGAFALMQGADYAYDPETGETSTFDPLLLPATTALGTAASIARVADDGSTVLGIMGGRMAKSGPGKFSAARAARGSKGRTSSRMIDQEVFEETGAFFDSKVLGSDIDAFRFEIPTANSALKGTPERVNESVLPQKGGLFKRGVQGEFLYHNKEDGVFGLRPDVTIARQFDDGRVYIETKSSEKNPEFKSFADARRKGVDLFKDLRVPKVSDVLDFPELFEEYPQLRNIPVIRLDGVDSGALYLDKGIDDKPTIAIGYTYNPKQFQSTLLHELQHAVQNIEGFPTGASPDTIVDTLDPRRTAKDAEARAIKLYRRVYGETEARNVQRRFEDPNLRRFVPTQTRDIKDSDLILTSDDVDDVADFNAAMSGPQASRLTDLNTFTKYLGGETLPNNPNRVFFPDLEFSEVTLRDSDYVDGALDIELLRAGKKGRGHGTEMMNRITQLADDTGKTFTLTPTPYGDGGLNLEELVEFYQSKGFRYIDPDPDNPDLDRPMVRYPRKAEGGVMGMVDLARDMTRGPRGVESLVPVARNMNRSMLG